MSNPFGRCSGNVFHTNVGFRWYVTTAFPTQLQTDADGMVSDFRSCLPFDMETGRDNAAPLLVEEVTSTPQSS